MTNDNVSKDTLPFLSDQGSNHLRPNLPESISRTSSNTYITCGICFENIVSFGFLINCNHHFCLACIRGWRGRTKKFRIPSAHTSCPLCRQYSPFILPSQDSSLCSDEISPEIQLKKLLEVQRYRSELEAMSSSERKFLQAYISVDNEFRREFPFRGQFSDSTSDSDLLSNMSSNSDILSSDIPSVESSLDSVDSSLDSLDSTLDSSDSSLDSLDSSLVSLDSSPDSENSSSISSGPEELSSLSEFFANDSEEVSSASDFFSSRYSGSVEGFSNNSALEFPGSSILSSSNETVSSDIVLQLLADNPQVFTSILPTSLEEAINQYYRHQLDSRTTENSETSFPDSSSESSF